MPTKPAKPSGPALGRTGTTYSYTTSANDPDGDKIRYGWDWNGDMVVDEWTTFYDPGIAISIPHSWSASGMYAIRVKAQDKYGAESSWSDLMSVIMPKPYQNLLWTLLEKLDEWLL